VCQRDRFAIIGFAAIFKGQANVFGYRGLIVFGDEHIMSGSFFDKIVGEFTLCQQCIGGDCFTVDSKRLDDGDEHPDFIGLFEFVATFYR